MSTLRKLAAVSALTLGLAATQQASAAFVNAVGNSFTVLFSDGGAINASAKFTVTTWDSSNDRAGFDLELTNNSSGGYSFVGLGIQNLTPTQDDEEVTGPNPPGPDPIDWNASDDGEFEEPSPDPQFELCFFDNNSCEDGTQGVNSGSFTLSFLLEFDNLRTSDGLTFTGFWGRFFEDVGSDSSKAISGCVVGEGSCGQQTASVPEPTTLALFSLGLLGLGFGTRRKSS